MFYNKNNSPGFSVAGLRYAGCAVGQFVQASGKLSEALWELSGDLSGSWGGHGGFRGILDKRCFKFIVFYSKNKTNNFVNMINLLSKTDDFIKDDTFA